MILKAFAILVLVIVFAFVLAAQGGDNENSRAMATVLYIPAIFFAVIDIVLWLIVLLR